MKLLFTAVILFCLSCAPAANALRSTQHIAVVNSNDSEILKMGDCKVQSNSRLAGCINAVVNHNCLKIQSLYVDFLKVDPSIAGKDTMKVKFAILANGEVRDIAVLKCTISNFRLRNSIINEIDNWNFGAIDSNGSVEIVVPLIFISKAEL
jgi:hypothetical protein